MPLQKTKHVYMYTQYRKHQHDYKKNPKIERLGYPKRQTE